MPITLSKKDYQELKESYSLSVNQIRFFQRMLLQYSSYANKDEILNSYRTFGFIDNLLEQDLKNRFKSKSEPKDTLITYDLLPDGTIRNFNVKQVSANQ